MFYLKRNLTRFERIARLAVALCLACVTAACVPPGWLAAVAYAAAVLTACTAVAGWCPACAMAGRKPVARSA